MHPLPHAAGEAELDRPSARKKPWLAPEILELPRLTDLTLQTGSPIDGSGDVGGGSTVF